MRSCSHHSSSYTFVWFLFLTTFLSCCCCSCNAFIGPQPLYHHHTTVLYSKIKRGKLGKTVGTGMVTTTKTSRTKVTNNNNNKKNKSSTTISPELTKWMMDNPQEEEDKKKIESNSISSSGTVVATRRERQSLRLAEQQAQKEKVQGYVEQLKTLLDTSENNKKTVSVDEILQVMRTLTQQQQQQQQQATTSIPLTQLVAAKNGRQDYRLAWVGSDDSVSHLGTGLHKVPLARLQEVFLSFPGRNRVVLQEVIRILGPFPNVRNTLSGSSQSSTKGDGVTQWNINWESMVDGTGKELLAGKEDNVKTVPLQVYYSDESVIVAARPCDDPWGGNGQNLLLFLREDDLESQLEALRVA